MPFEHWQVAILMTYVTALQGFIELLQCLTMEKMVDRGIAENM